jgi:F0F1-type ATP synthase membrane subunit b/b'
MSSIELKKIINEFKENIHKLVTEIEEHMNKYLRDQENSNTQVTKIRKKMQNIQEEINKDIEILKMTTFK